MRFWISSTVVFISFFLFILLQGSAVSNGKKTQVEHGRYLTERVAMCIQCHSPRDENGNLILEEKFKGAPIPVNPPYSESQWAVRAPAIAGLPGYSEAAAIRLLTEGIAASGKPPSPPMPPFRFTRRDAEAVVAYLKSLG